MASSGPRRHLAGAGRGRTTRTTGAAGPARYYRHVAAEDLARAATRRRPRRRARRHRELAAQPAAGHRQRPGLHPDRRGARLDVAAHTRRRGRHRRHAVPRRLGHRRAQPPRARRSTCVVHPQLVVRRDVDRRSCIEVLRDVRPPDDAAPTRIVESWMHVEIDREPTTRPSATQLAADLQRVLRDVREAVEDWPKMRARALQHRRRARPTTPPPGCPSRRSPRRTELLRWLADDHFTFLGYREYELRRADGDGDDAAARRARHRPGHPARRPAAGARRFGRLPPEVAATGPRAAAAGPHQGQLAARPCTARPTSTTSASRCSTTTARSIGERRFLGLFTSAAYTESVRAIPVLRRKVGRGAGPRPGSPATATPARTCCRSWRPTRATSCSRSPPTSCCRSRSACCTCRSAARLRLFLRQDDYGRFMLLPGLPARATATPPQVRLRDAGDPARRARRRRASTTPPGSPSRCWPGCTSSSGSTRPTPCPTSTPAELEAELVARDPVLGRRLRRRAASTSCGEEQAPRLRRGLRRRVPRGLQGGLPAARRRSPTCAGWRRSQPTATSTCSLYAPRGRRARRAPASRSTASASRSRCPQVLPVLQRMGVEVVDERPYEIDAARTGRRPGSTTSGCATSRPARLARRRRAGRGSRTRSPPSGRGEAESDGFNALVLRRRADLAAGDGAARLREVPAPGRDDLQPGLHRGRASRRTRTSPRCWCSCSRPGSTRPRSGAGQRGRSTALLEEIDAARSTQVASLDQDRILRSFLGVDPGDPAHQLLPARRRTAGRKSYVVVQARPAADARPAGAAAAVRDLGLLARGSRACTCGSARSPAAGCAGPTGARTSAPRCSAWSRRRW